MSTSDGRCRSDAMIPGSLRRCCFRPPQAASERSARGDDHGGRVQETRAGWTRKRRRLTRLPTSSPFRLAAPTSPFGEGIQDEIPKHSPQATSRHLGRDRRAAGPDAPGWRFAPGHLRLDAGGTLAAHNRGGEDHTFTEVADFGGGCIAAVNALLGLTPVPECAGFPGGAFAATTVSPGDTVTTSPLSPGIHRFECLIHPWMQTTVTVG